MNKNIIVNENYIIQIKMSFIRKSARKATDFWLKSEQNHQFQSIYTARLTD